MDLIKLISEYYPECLTMEEERYDECIIGVQHSFGSEPRVAYDYHKVMAKYIVEDGMDFEEAMEYFNFNVIGAWVGPNTPVFIETFEGCEPEMSGNDDCEPENDENE